MSKLNRSLSFLWLLSALALPGLAQADAVRDWLNKIQKAVRMTNYQGTFVYREGDQMEVMRVTHRAGTDGVHEKLVSMNGWAREIIRDNDKVTCYLPDKKSIMAGHNMDISADKNFPSLLPAQTEKLKNVYAISVHKSERIAGRTTQMLTIVPRDAFRYGYRFWADNKTGLLLKSDLIDTDGKILEQFMFTAITIGGTIPDSELKPSYSGKGMVWQRADQTTLEVNTSDWAAADLPHGFELTKHMVRALPGKPHPVTHLVFSDGLAAVSVFVEKEVPVNKKSERIATGMGGVHAYRTRRDDFQVTAVGEVPAITVSKIGDSVHRLH